MINKKKPPDKNQEEQVYKIIKCPLKSVLKEYTKLQPIIDDVVKDITPFSVNIETLYYLVFSSYLFIKSFACINK